MIPAPRRLLPALLLTAALAALATTLACAEEPAPTAPPPAPAPGKPAEETGAGKPATLTQEEVDRLLLRGQRNLALHGLSLSPDHLYRAVEDFRAAFDGLGADAGPERRFDAGFSLAFSLARVELPAEKPDADAILAEIRRAHAAAEAIHPEFPGLVVVRGMVKERLGDLAEAAADITRGLDALEGWKGLRPWQTYQLRLFGLLARGRAFLAPAADRALLAEKDFLAARDLAEQALTDPEAPPQSALRRVVLTHLAAAKQRLDYYAETEKILEFLLKDDPGNPSHPLNMAFIHARQFRFPQAIEWYRKAVALDRRNPVPHLKIAFILLKHPEPGKSPDVEAAEREADVYRSLVGSEDAEYRCVRGEALHLRGKDEEAAVWFRKALGLEPRCQTALLRLIQILGRRAEPTEADREEIEMLKKRLQDASQQRNTGGGTEKSDYTFC